MFTLDARTASHFARLALAHVRREYPNKLDHVLLDATDICGPRALHPVFYGSFDWHSCVHGYWMLARLLRRFPALPEQAQIRALFDEQLTAAKVTAEVSYAANPTRGGFERPYGWAWLLKLAAELETHPAAEAVGWRVALAPLARLFSSRFGAFLPKATYPIRVGTHFNSAFALRLALDYARTLHDTALERTLCDAATRWYRDDRACQGWEPGGDDFLSSALMEATCMHAVLLPAAFAAWFAAFLPHLAEREPASLFTPAIVSDRSDGKIAHLDGLNLSRAWCWRVLATTMMPTDPRRSLARDAASVHLAASLPHVSGDYMGEHWLATFAMLALDA